MKITYDKGLLFTSLEISFNGNIKTINNIVIDSGASRSLIDPDCVSDLKISADSTDKMIKYSGVGGYIHYAFRKNIDSIKLDTCQVQNIDIDFAPIDDTGEINGLLGLDLLIKLNANINFKTLELHTK